MLQRNVKQQCKKSQGSVGPMSGLLGLNNINLRQNFNEDLSGLFLTQIQEVFLCN